MCLSVFLFRTFKRFHFVHKTTSFENNNGNRNNASEGGGEVVECCALATMRVCVFIVGRRP